MTVNVTNLINGLITVTEELIGTQLSTVGGTNGNPSSPAVFRARGSFPKPSFPYATVDFLGRNREGRSLISSQLNPDTDMIVQESDYVYSFLINIYDDDFRSESISQELEDRLVTIQGLDSICTNTGFQLRSADPTAFSSAFLNTDYQEVSGVMVDLAVRSTVSTAADIITTIEQGGNLYPHEIGEGTPLEVDATAP